MAQTSAGANKLTLFSLTGYLQLLQKKNLFKNAFRKYWFWFDEQTCCLKYYRSQETYTQGVNEPLGVIDLRYAKVTPGITSGSSSNNVFNVTANGQTYVIAAGDSNEALAWISNLQEKRGDYIKLSAVLDETAQEQEKDRRTLQLSKPVGALAQTTEEDSVQRSPTSVRKIVRSKLSHGSMALELVSSPLGSPRRSTFDRLAPHHSLSYDDQLDGASDDDYENPGSMPLTPQGRRVLELEAACINYQTHVDKLQREIMRLKEQVENRDKAILDLNLDLEQAKENAARMNKPHRELKHEITSLNDIIEQYKRSVKSLDGEIELQKLNQKEHEKKILVEKQKGLEMEKELNVMKSKYIKLLSTKFKVDIPNSTHGQDETGEDLELTKCTNELMALVAQEGGVNLYRGSFEDEFGEIHDWQNDLVTHHYLCRQLYLHYNQQDQMRHTTEWEEFLSQVRRTRKPYLDLASGERVKLRGLLRKGVPIQFRMIVWTSLVFQLVGRMKETRDAAVGGSYYWSLVHSDEKSESEKQIKIDLHRTLPNNRHFKLNGSGIPKLENILIAFSKHNKKIGYCQGMNMVAALGLLFLDEETVFWYMVCITERLLPEYYYTPDLMGAQADQLLMKDLLMEKLPRLGAHLDSCGIDVTFVTLNWFLTLFVDSMPTESALRIMDCFLMEGTKFIFRTSLSILRLSQSTILQKRDSFVLFQFVKELAKHIFDMETLFQEFPKLQPFPNRATLSSRHNHHLAKVKVQWEKKGKERAEKERQRTEVKSVLLSSSFMPKDTHPQPAQQAPVQRLVWDCGCVCGQGEVWLCGGEGKLGVVSTGGGNCQLSIPTCRIFPRVICVHYLETLDLMLVGTLDFNLAAIDCATKAERWRHTLTDSVLAITGSKEKTFAALANGLVAMFQDVTAVDAPEPRILRVGPTTVSSMVLCDPDQQYLWCGCGKCITVMSTESLEPVESLMTTERVNKMVGSEVGVWVSFRSASLLALYDTRQYVLLLSIDYCTVLPPLKEFTEEAIQSSHHRITSLMMAGDKLWLGTGGGRVLVFTYATNVPDTEEAIRNLVKHKKMADSETTPTAKSPDGGGLLTNVSVEGKEAGATPEEEKWVNISDPNSTPSPALSPDSAIPSHYDKRRRNQFGRTLRNKVHKHYKRQDCPDIYHLEFVLCSDIITSDNDSVRVLVAFSGADDTRYAVSCLNTVKTDWKKGVQLWACPQDTNPAQWVFETLPPSEETAPPNPSPTHPATAAADQL